MSEKMKAIVIRVPGSAQIETVSIPEPAVGEVLIRVDTCLLCTWEQRLFQNGGGMTLPYIPGHEFSGTIAAVGPDTPTTFCIGDPVVGKTLDSCGHCEFCYRGEDNQCTGKPKKRYFDGIMGAGGLAQYLALSVSRVFPIENPDLPMGLAAFCEPVACCLRSLERANIEMGEDVVIVGAGIMGQLHQLLAKKRGARTIVVDLDQSRLDQAKKAGADIVLNPSDGDPIARILELTHGHGAQVVFFTLPSTKLAQDYIEALGKLGRMIYYGSFHPANDMAVNPNKIHYSEKVITGAYSPTTRSFYQAARILSNGIIDVKPFLSELYPISEANTAFARAMSPETFRVGIELWK
ncbi:MAG: zinc-binding dehydrogenase [Bacillota bacterium]